jgi:hypothetical protein
MGNRLPRSHASELNAIDIAFRWPRTRSRSHVPFVGKGTPPVFAGLQASKAHEIGYDTPSLGCLCRGGIRSRATPLRA